ncbi:MAG: hypothetical protein AAF667_20150 [Pseudomonadota bacterium]
MRHSDEDVLKPLREIKVELSAGDDLASTCRSAGIREASTRPRLPVAPLASGGLCPKPGMAYEVPESQVTDRTYEPEPAEPFYRNLPFAP